MTTPMQSRRGNTTNRSGLSQAKALSVASPKPFSVTSRSTYVKKIDAIDTLWKDMESELEKRMDGSSKEKDSRKSDEMVYKHNDSGTLQKLNYKLVPAQKVAALDLECIENRTESTCVSGDTEDCWLNAHKSSHKDKIQVRADPPASYAGVAEQPISAGSVSESPSQRKWWTRITPKAKVTTGEGSQVKPKTPKTVQNAVSVAALPIEAGSLADSTTSKGQKGFWRFGKKSPEKVKVMVSPDELRIFNKVKAEIAVRDQKANVKKVTQLKNQAWLDAVKLAIEEAKKTPNYFVAKAGRTPKPKAMRQQDNKSSLHNDDTMASDTESDWSYYNDNESEYQHAGTRRVFCTAQDHDDEEDDNDDDDSSVESQGFALDWLDCSQFAVSADQRALTSTQPERQQHRRKGPANTRHVRKYSF